VFLLGGAAATQRNSLEEGAMNLAEFKGPAVPQGCQIFLGTAYVPKWGKIYQITTKYTNCL
jgi:hypothetical protein